MYSAYLNQKELVTLWNLSAKKIEYLKKYPFTCPVCSFPVYIKNGSIKAPHFSHYNKTQCFLDFESETKEHLTLKKLVAKWCEKENINYELEKYLPTIHQRPDILIDNMAIEIQCSPLPIQKLIDRTRSYLSAGYYPIWICGEKLWPKRNQKLGELLKHFIYYSQKLGFFLWGANWLSQELFIYFHLEEDWQQKIYYNKKSWKFQQNKLIDILNYPRQATIFNTRKHLTGELVSNYYLALNKEVIKKSKKIQCIQSELYKNHLHILHLPRWFYYPGILLFGCKISDIFIKLAVWKKLANLRYKYVELTELKNLLEKELVCEDDFFYSFPNIQKKILYNHNLEQLIDSLIICDCLIESKNGRYYVVCEEDQVMAELLYQWFDRMKNSYLISSVPVRNMIKLK